MSLGAKGLRNWSSGDDVLHCHVKCGVRILCRIIFYIIMYMSARNQGTTENRRTGHCAHTSATTKHSTWKITLHVP